MGNQDFGTNKNPFIRLAEICKDKAKEDSIPFYFSETSIFFATEADKAIATLVDGLAADMLCNTKFKYSSTCIVPLDEKTFESIVVKEVKLSLENSITRCIPLSLDISIEIEKLDSLPPCIKTEKTKGFEISLKAKFVE